MARVTVEDCVLKVPNRFELVALAAQRSRGISAGAPLTLERDNDKNPVVALREIADETIDLEELKASVIRGMQKHIEKPMFLPTFLRFWSLPCPDVPKPYVFLGFRAPLIRRPISDSSSSQKR